MSNKLEKVINYYNNIAIFPKRLLDSAKALISFNFGQLLKIWFIDKNFNNLDILEQNFIYTQHLQLILSKIVSTNRHNGKNIKNSEWENLFKECRYDHFLHNKLQDLIGVKNKNLLDSILPNIDNINLSSFSDFIEATQLFVETNLNKYKELYEAAEKINITAYPLTKEYFIYRYISKAILTRYSPELRTTINKEFEKEKKACLNFAHYINSLEQSYTRIEQATSKFDEENKVTSWLIQKSDVVSYHASKIAISYSVLIAGVIALRSYVFDEEDPLYELCALPTTTLAILQIILSFPSTILSPKQTKQINNNMFKVLDNKLQGNSNSSLEDIKFLFDNTPSFSNEFVNTTAICFRYASNLLLQPIDLLNNNTINNFIVWTALRWSVAAGVIEEQSKVTNFMYNKLTWYLHDNIAPSLIENKKLPYEEIKPYFYLLYKHLAKDKNKQEQLKTIYNKLTDQVIDFEDSSDTHTYYNWQYVAKYSAIATLILDYICFYYRNPEIEFYEDSMFYASTSIKLMRLCSLLISTYCGNKVIENVTQENLTHDILFQNFYYNDAARLTMAIIPLIMFESIKDLKFLSIATLIDVLTTAKSDLKVGVAISSAGKIVIEKTSIIIDCLYKNINNHLDLSYSTVDIDPECPTTELLGQYTKG